MMDSDNIRATCSNEKRFIQSEHRVIWCVGEWMNNNVTKTSRLLPLTFQFGASNTEFPQSQSSAFHWLCCGSLVASNQLYKERSWRKLPTLPFLSIIILREPQLEQLSYITTATLTVLCRHLTVIYTSGSLSESVAHSAGATDSAIHCSITEVPWCLGSAGVGEDSLDSAGDLQRLMAPGLLAEARWPLAPFITLHSVDRHGGNTWTSET